MEWLINTIKELWSWFTSLEGVGTVTLGSIVTFVVQLLLKNKSILKANFYSKKDYILFHLNNILTLSFVSTSNQVN